MAASNDMELAALMSTDAKAACQEILDNPIRQDLEDVLKSKLGRGTGVHYMNPINNMESSGSLVKSWYISFDDADIIGKGNYISLGNRSLKFFNNKLMFYAPTGRHTTPTFRRSANDDLETEINIDALSKGGDVTDLMNLLEKGKGGSLLGSNNPTMKKLGAWDLIKDNVKNNLQKYVNLYFPKFL